MTEHPGEIEPVDKPCRVVRVDVQQDFLMTDDEMVYVAVCSTGEEFTGDSTGAALAAHHSAHLWEEADG